jgi:hypothetical protein
MVDFIENHTLLCFEKPYKKSAQQENSSLFMKSILQNGKMRVETQTVWEDLSLCQEILTKNAIQEFHLWKQTGNNWQLLARSSFGTATKRSITQRICHLT